MSLVFSMIPEAFLQRKSIINISKKTSHIYDGFWEHFQMFALFLVIWNIYREYPTTV